MGHEGTPRSWALLWTLLGTMSSLFRTQRELALGNLALRQQVAALIRTRGGRRLRLGVWDRALWVTLSPRPTPPAPARARCSADGMPGWGHVPGEWRSAGSRVLRRRSPATASVRAGLLRSRRHRNLTRGRRHRWRRSPATSPGAGPGTSSGRPRCRSSGPRAPSPAGVRVGSSSTYAIRISRFSALPATLRGNSS